MALSERALAQPPAEGSVSVNLDGSFIYTPTLSFIGDDTFTYVATDGALESGAV